MMEIRLISLDERYRIIDKFKEFFQEPKRNLNSQFYSSIMSPKDYNKGGLYRPQTF